MLSERCAETRQANRRLLEELRGTVGSMRETRHQAGERRAREAADGARLRLPPGPSPAAGLGPRFRLTSREAEVALLLAQGYSNAELARRLGISPHTARHHTESVLAKLGVRSRAQAGALLHGWAPPPGGTGAPAAQGG
jgi:DNA-binding CsgD family transcriptional regulator